MPGTIRYILGCLFAGAVGLLISQSSDLHRRFGEPTAETCNAGPGISLTVQYGSDRLVCQALIDPPQPLLHGEEEVPNMSSEEVSKIVEEIAPEEVRGKELSRIITNGGCNQFTIVEYENVVVTRSSHNCLPLQPDREMRATVSFKRVACPAWQRRNPHETEILLFVLPHYFHRCLPRCYCTDQSNRPYWRHPVHDSHSEGFL
jgi:hypothetical protein